MTVWGGVTAKEVVVGTFRQSRVGGSEETPKVMLNAAFPAWAPELGKANKGTVPQEVALEEPMTKASQALLEELTIVSPRGPELHPWFL